MANTKEECMLYVGAFMDMWPVIRYGIWVKHFIYVDGLPDSKYFEPVSHGYKFCKDLDVMIQAIKDNVPGGCISVTRVRENVYDFQLNGVRLTYIFNTLTTDLNTVSDLISNITSMYVCGYVPSEFDKKLTPKLRTVFSSIKNVQSDVDFGPDTSVIETGGVQYHEDTQGFTQVYRSYKWCNSADKLHETLL